MDNKTSGLIAWFAKNPVAANLIMLFIVVAGGISVYSISKDMFPRSEVPMIQIIAPYPGAAPVEVEKGVILPMESALEGLRGIKKISSNARRDSASITLEVEVNEDINEVMVQVENRIDGIVNFPEDLEKPTVKKFDVFGWVMGVSLSGPMSDRQRKILGQQVYDELMVLPEVKKVMLWGVDDYEIAVEVKEDRLREFNLTLGEVAQVLRASSLDLPAGIIRAEAGNVLVRTQGKAYVGDEFAKIVLLSQADGTQILLSDVADIKDGFVETNNIVRFDREKAFNLGIFSLEDQNLLTISDSVKQYVDQKQATLPDGLKINYFADESYHLRGRLDMMIENLAMGAILVAIILGLFLNLRVAFWVLLGIPVSFLGAFWLMPVNPYPVTVNVLSLFAFIMVLGIVVDDAIVIGESVFDEVEGDYKK
jgi:multidrug efflux pump subunit AcrB